MTGHDLLSLLGQKKIRQKGGAVGMLLPAEPL